VVDLSRYVVKTAHKGDDLLYNTVTKKSLPVLSDESTLRSNYFLAGQERESVDHVLFDPNVTLGYKNVVAVTLVPTWECNLRCTHCSVLKLLKKHDPTIVTPDEVVGFVERCLTRFTPEYLVMTFLGGEPLLRTPICLEVARRVKELCESRGVKPLPNLTTNLTLDLTEEQLEFFDLCTEIGVSVDGEKEAHNWQRIPLAGVGPEDPYEVTMRNLKELVEYGFEDRIRVKAALRQQFMTKEHYERFLKLMTGIGIPANRVTFGSAHPTDHHLSLDEEMFRLSHKARINLIGYPCCKFRVQTEYWIQPDGNLYDVAFGYARDKLGTVNDDLEKIVENRKVLVREKFPCFNDPGCDDCPVLGYCWGGCVNAQMVVKDRPSHFCNREGLTQHVTRLAKEGILIQNDLDKRQFAICERRLQEMMSETGN
jgi:radical SAM protein with 4Fe4S-binding SPASM domain